MKGKILNGWVRSCFDGQYNHFRNWWLIFINCNLLSSLGVIFLYNFCSKIPGYNKPPAYNIKKSSVFCTGKDSRILVKSLKTLVYVSASSLEDNISGYGWGVRPQSHLHCGRTTGLWPWKSCRYWTFVLSPYTHIFKIF